LIHSVVMPEINNFYIIILDMVIEKYCIGQIAYISHNKLLL